MRRLHHHLLMRGFEAELKLYSSTVKMLSSTWKVAFLALCFNVFPVHCMLSCPRSAVLALRAGDEPATNDGFEILDEKQVYSGWRTIIQRKVRMRNGKVADFDLVGVKTGGGAVLVFAWDSKTKSVTLIREYMPGSNKILWGLAAGLVEGKHGQDSLVAARHELEEECHLVGGTWIPLCKGPSAMDKYALTDIEIYLVIDPEPAENPKPLDDEEDIEIVPGVKIPEIMDYIVTGNMNLVSGWGCLLAIAKLQEMGEYTGV